MDQNKQIEEKKEEFIRWMSNAVRLDLLNKIEMEQIIDIITKAYKRKGVELFENFLMFAIECSTIDDEEEEEEDRRG